ncbi:MAG: hypothetical protein VYA30_09220 [Myxococcota bacterium]|nr:hypothetical protein [Myxococcota bacterium]
MLLVKPNRTGFTFELRDWSIDVGSPSPREASVLATQFFCLLRNHMTLGYTAVFTVPRPDKMVLSVTIRDRGLTAVFLDAVRNPHCPESPVSWTNLYEFLHVFLKAPDDSVDWQHAPSTVNILDQACPIKLTQSGGIHHEIEHLIVRPDSPQPTSGHNHHTDLSKMHAVHYERTVPKSTEKMRLIGDTLFAEINGYVHGLCFGGRSDQIKVPGALIESIESGAMSVWKDGYLTYHDREALRLKTAVETGPPQLCGYSPPNLVVTNQDGVGEMSNLEQSQHRYVLNYDQLGRPLVHQTVERHLWQILDSGLFLQFSPTLQLRSISRCQGTIVALVPNHGATVYLCLKVAAQETQILKFCRASGALSLAHHIRGRYVDFTKDDNGALFFLFETADGISILSQPGEPLAEPKLTRISGIAQASSVTYLGKTLLIVEKETHWLWNIESGTCVPQWQTSGHRGVCPPLVAGGLCFTIGHELEIRSIVSGHILCRLKLEVGEPDAWCIDNQGALFLLYGRDLEVIHRRGYIGLITETV